MAEEGEHEKRARETGTQCSANYVLRGANQRRRVEEKGSREIGEEKKEDGRKE